MALPTTYRVGAVTVSANETAVAGEGANWIAGGVRAGDIFAARGLTSTIASVDSATSLTLSEPWPGSGLSNAEYEIRYTPDASRVLAASKAALVAIEETYDGSRTAIAQAQLRKNNLTGSRAPLPTDDASQGYEVGSRWLWQGQEWVYLGSGRWVRRGDLTPLHFSNDFAAGVNAAIAYLASIGGGVVTVPFGNYVQTAPINMASGVTVRCEPGAAIDAGAISSGHTLGFIGSVEAEHNLTANVTVGASIITAPSANFAVGDLVHLVSQRNALSRADAGDWWCGAPTAGDAYAYFAEFATIAAVLGGGQYRLSAPIMFPDYRTDAAQETQSNRARATVKRVIPCRNAHWLGGTIRKRAGSAYTHRGEWAKDCTVDGVTFDLGARLGTAIEWVASYGCITKNTTCVNDPALVWDYSTLHGKLNRYKTIGSQGCGFDGCSTEYAAQPVDFTYGVVNGHGPFLNVGSFCRNGRFRHNFEGLTSHPACYREVWEGNTVLAQFGEALLVRGLEPTIRRNTFEGPFYPGATEPTGTVSGLMLAYGGPRRASVQDNIITGFPYGVFLLDSSTLDWRFRRVDAEIWGNAFNRCWVAIRTDFLAWTGLRVISIEDNTASNVGFAFARLQRYSAGTFISSNTVIGDMVSTSGSAIFVYMRANNPFVVVENNRWYRTKGGNPGQNKFFVYCEAVTDTATYPQADYERQSIWAGNRANYGSELSADTEVAGAYPLRPA